MCSTFQSFQRKSKWHLRPFVQAAVGLKLARILSDMTAERRWSKAIGAGTLVS